MSSDAEDMFGCGCAGLGASALGLVMIIGLLSMGDCAGCIDMAEVVHGKPDTRIEVPSHTQKPVTRDPGFPNCNTAIRLESANDAEWICMDP
jgi:hypothetical protein